MPQQDFQQKQYGQQELEKDFSLVGLYLPSKTSTKTLNLMKQSKSTWEANVHLYHQYSRLITQIMQKVSTVRLKTSWSKKTHLCQGLINRKLHHSVPGTGTDAHRPDRPFPWHFQQTTNFLWAWLMMSLYGTDQQVKLFRLIANCVNDSWQTRLCIQ